MIDTGCQTKKTRDDKKYMTDEKRQFRDNAKTDNKRKTTSIRRPSRRHINDRQKVDNGKQMMKEDQIHRQIERKQMKEGKRPK